MDQKDGCPFSMLSEHAKLKAIECIKRNQQFLSWQSVGYRILEAFQLKISQEYGVGGISWIWYEFKNKIIFKKFSIPIPESAIKPIVCPKDYENLQKIKALSNQEMKVVKSDAGNYEIYFGIYSQKHSNDREVFKKWLSFIVSNPSLMSLGFEEKWKAERFRMRMENRNDFDPAAERIILKEVVSITTKVCSEIAKAYDALDKEWRTKARKTIKEEIDRFQNEGVYEWFMKGHPDTKDYRFHDDGSLV